MAEIIGVIASGITLAALFKTCIEAFDIIQTGHNQELDLRKLVLRLSIEKCRLFTWGESMGLTNASDDAETNASASCQFREVMMETLQTIFQLFSDSKKLQDRYGCKQYLDSSTANENEQTSQVKFLAASFDNFKMTPSWRGRRSKLLMKARWAIQDRKKFAGFVSEIKELVDGLQHITKPLVPLSQQENAMKLRIETINDPETLDMVSDVCQDDHSELSKIALAKAETISLASTNRWNIERWDYRLETVGVDEMVDLESMNITELKHQMLRMIRERRELASHLQHFQRVVPELSNFLTFSSMVPRIVGNEATSPSEYPPKGPFDSEDNAAESSLPTQSPKQIGLKQNISDVGVPACQLAQPGQILTGCSTNTSASSGKGHATPSDKEFPTGRSLSDMPPFSLTERPGDPLGEGQEIVIQSIADINTTEAGVEDIPDLFTHALNDGAPIYETLTYHPAAFARLEAPLNSNPGAPEGSSNDINDKAQARRTDSPVQNSKTSISSGKEQGPVTATSKPRITWPGKSKDAADHNTLFNGFIDYDILMGSKTRTGIQREDYFVLSFNVPKRAGLLESLGHAHYAPASYVARLTSSRNSPTIPLKWPRNLQITRFVDGNSIDKLLHESFSRPLLHIYAFGIFEVSTVCSVKGGCLRALFDVLAESREYAECRPEIISSHYPTPGVYVLPIGADAVVPLFLRQIQPTLEPRSPILLVLLIYTELDFAILNDNSSDVNGLDENGYPTISNPFSFTYDPPSSTYDTFPSTYDPLSSTYDPLSSTYDPLSSTYDPFSST